MYFALSAQKTAGSVFGRRHTAVCRKTGGKMVGIAESDKRGYLRNRKRGCGKQLRRLFQSYIHNVTVNRHTCSVPEYRAEVIRVIGEHLRKPRKRQLSGVIRADIVGDPRTEPRIALRMTVGNEITGILYKCRRAVFGMLRAAENSSAAFVSTSRRKEAP